MDIAFSTLGAHLAECMFHADAIAFGCGVDFSRASVRFATRLNDALVSIGAHSSDRFTFHHYDLDSNDAPRQLET